MRIRMRTRGRQFIAHSDYWSAGNEAINDHDHGDDKEQVNETAADGYHERPKNPQDEQNHRDRPKHICILNEGWPAITRCDPPLGNCRTVTPELLPGSAWSPLNEGRRVTAGRNVLLLVESLPAEEYAQGPDIVSDVYQQERQIAASP